MSTNKSICLAVSNTKLAALFFDVVIKADLVIGESDHETDHMPRELEGIEKPSGANLDHRKLAKTKRLEFSDVRLLGKDITEGYAAYLNALYPRYRHLVEDPDQPGVGIQIYKSYSALTEPLFKYHQFLKRLFPQTAIFGLDAIGQYKYAINDGPGNNNFLVSDYTKYTERPVECTLSNLDIIDARSASWEHISEIRKDPESISSLRRLKVWARKEMRDLCMNEAKDLLEVEVEKYNIAIKKHGLNTRKGIVTQLLDKDVISASSATLASILLENPDLVTASVVATSTLLAAKIAIESGASISEHNNLKFNHPLAFIMAFNEGISDQKPCFEVEDYWKHEYTLDNI